MDRSQPTSTNLMDTHNRLIADILTRYRALIMLSTIQSAGDRANDKPEAIAVAGISMKIEFDGLYSSIKELLTLSRKMKELWVFGPLGKEDSDGRERREGVEKDVRLVEGLLREMEGREFGELARGVGGEWVGKERGEGVVMQ